MDASFWSASAQRPDRRAQRRRTKGHRWLRLRPAVRPAPPLRVAYAPTERAPPRPPQVNNDVTLSAAHNLANKALKTGITYNTKVGRAAGHAMPRPLFSRGPALGCGGRQGARAPAQAAGACMSACATPCGRGAYTPASGRATLALGRAELLSQPSLHSHHSRPLPPSPQVADKRTQLKLNYLTKGGVLTGEVNSQVAPNKKVFVNFDRTQVRGTGAQEGAG